MPQPGERTSTSHRTGRRFPVRQIVSTFWSEWRVEIAVAFVVILAVLLLVEDVQIRQTLLNGLQEGLRILDAVVWGTWRAVNDFVRDTTLSDLIAYVLLLFAFGFASFRLRWRLMRVPRLQRRECPRCGGEVYRIHRHAVDRLISLYLPVRRYQCANRGCQWEGLRVGKGQH